MSIYLSGITFPDCFVSPANDAAFMAKVARDGRISGCLLSRSGSTLHITAGRLLACGRGVGVDTALDIPVTGASSGYARLILTIDRSQSAVSGNFKQARFDLEYASTLAGFEELTQDDINNGGTVYQMVVCVMSLGSAGITGIVSTCGDAHGRAAGVAVTLLASGWANNFQTVRCDGVTADKSKCHVVPTFDPEHEDAYTAAGILAYAQGDGTVTFRCSTEPDADIPVNVLLL